MCFIVLILNALGPYGIKCGFDSIRTIQKGQIHMKISTKGRYSLRLMIDLAQHYGEGYIALKDISARQGISKKYLEQIIPFLNRSGLLHTNRGQQGGYRLAKMPCEITAFDILTSAEGNLAPVSCMETSPNDCEKCSYCKTLPIYEGLYKVVKDYLSGITLEDIITTQRNGDDYSI